MIIDVHGHIWLARQEESKGIVTKVCERYHIQRVYISTLNAHMPDEGEVIACNDATRDFMRESPELVGGMVYLNPRHSNTMREMRKRIEEQGMEGVKLWVATFCDDERVYPIAEQAIAYDVPILIHAFKKTVGQLPFETLGSHVANLARRYPELKILMAHIGANVYDTIKCVKDYPNVYTDISSSIYRNDDVDYAIHHLGVERVLFGTDTPGVTEDCIGQVLGADLTDEERDMVFAGNARRLFNLGKGGTK